MIKLVTSDILIDNKIKSHITQFQNNGQNIIKLVCYATIHNTYNKILQY